MVVIPIRSKTAAVFAAVLITVLALPVTAHATDTADDDIRWSVQPADETQPDGRRWVEWSGEPGSSHTDHLAVRNLSAVEVNFRLEAADGFLTETGRFNILDPSQESVDAGLWIDIADSVSVPAGGLQIVPFTVTIPSNATPGDHFAGVAASITSGEGTVGVQSRVGFRVVTLVEGDLVPSIAVQDVRAEYEPTLNPFLPGRIVVSYLVHNDGNVSLGVTPIVRDQALFGIVQRDTAGSVVDEILPGGQREVTAVIDGVWPLGPLSVTAMAEPLTDISDDLDVATAPTVIVWTIPWTQGVCLLVLAGAIVLILFTRRRRARRVDQLVANARQQGRQEASSSVPETVDIP